MSNSLTVLGLIYKKIEQWDKQLENLEQSKEIVTSSLDKTGHRQFKVLLAGVNAEIGLCHSKMGDHEQGLELVLPTIKELDDLISEDPKDGQARRYLKGNLEFLAEILRRQGRFNEAKKYFDRLVELEGGQVQLTRSAAQIETLCGLEN